MSIATAPLAPVELGCMWRSSPDLFVTLFKIGSLYLSATNNGGRVTHRPPGRRTTSKRVWTATAKRKAGGLLCMQQDAAIPPLFDRVMWVTFNVTLPL